MKTNSKKKLSILDCVTISSLPKGLKTAKTQEDIKRIEIFREKIFSRDYPELNNYQNDPHDPFSLVLYTESDDHKITSTARLIFDNPIGFPADDYASKILNENRNKGIKMVEAGRLAISDEAKGAISLYYKAFFSLSLENSIDSVVVVINQNHLKFYIKRLGAKVHTNNIENMNGSGLNFSCAEWELDKTSKKFFKWVGLEPLENKEAPYAISTWNSYSRMFAGIYTDYQRKVYQETIQYLHGSVIDLGCGPARLAPLLVDNKNIVQYIGVEYAQDMFKIAEFTMNKLSNPSFKVIHNSVDEVKGQYSSAVSLLSYYAFPEPLKSLKHIFDILQPGANFVLANPNENLNQIKIQKMVEKEMMWHPDYELFKKYNLELADNRQAEFTSMDQLIKQLQLTGFKIVACHQKYYEGGLNYIVCRKPE